MKLEDDKNSLLQYVEESIKEKEDLLKEIQGEKEQGHAYLKDIDLKKREVLSL